MIVEDELLVRMGLAAAVEWEKFDMTICSLSADGQSAYEAFESERADIIITDVKMPKLNGIDLIRKIRNVDKKCKIIVVTCLEDFNTLHEAFNMGISGYLLKATMTSDNLTDLLVKIKDELDADLNKKAKPVVEKNDISILKDHFLTGTPLDDFDAFDTISAIIGIAFKAENSSLLQVKSASASFYERISGMGKVFVIEKENTSYYIMMRPSEYDHEQGRSIYYDLQNYIRGVFELDATAVACKIDVKPDNFTRVCVAIDRYLCDDYFIIFDFSIITDDAKLICPAFNERIQKLQENPMFYGYRAWAIKAKYFELLANVEHEFGISKRRFCEALEKLAKFVFSEDGVYAHVTGVNEYCAKINTYKTAIDALDGFVSLYPDSGKHSLYSEDITSTTQFMQEHISENITLPHMASMINISPNYYAALFKQAVGINFSEYLGKIRLDYACDLLKNTDKSIQEISQMCGFSDVTYFTRYFKQNIGEPPKRWRTHNEA